MGMSQTGANWGDILLSFPAADLFMVFLLLGSACAQNTVKG